MLTSLLFAITMHAPIAPEIQIKTAPAQVWFDRESPQQLNFDFMITNGRKEAIEIARVEVSAYDASGKLLLRKFINNSGFSPSLNTVFPDRKVEPGATGMMFNPFYILPPDVEPARLDFDFQFEEGDKVWSSKLTVTPKAYMPKTALIFPVKGRLIIDDGNDFYGHHRRMHFTHPFAQTIGFRSNFMRYALDFVNVDAAGARHKGDGMTNEQWYGWKGNVVAPGDGVVVGVLNDYVDNDVVGKENKFDEARVMKEPITLYGNHVVIDHENGEFSMIGHVLQGSVRVKVGERVKRGQTIAAMGSSGSSIYPHVHYELRTDPGISGEGLPPYFVDYTLHRGSKSMKVKRGTINSGDIAERQ
jgi:hypothetical protein